MWDIVIAWPLVFKKCPRYIQKQGLHQKFKTRATCCNSNVIVANACQWFAQAWARSQKGCFLDNRAAQHKPAAWVPTFQGACSMYVIVERFFEHEDHPTWAHNMLDNMSHVPSLPQNMSKNTGQIVPILVSPVWFTYNLPYSWLYCKWQELMCRHGARLLCLPLGAMGADTVPLGNA